MRALTGAKTFYGSSDSKASTFIWNMTMSSNSMDYVKVFPAAWGHLREVLKGKNPSIEKVIFTLPKSWAMLGHCAALSESDHFCLTISSSYGKPRSALDGKPESQQLIQKACPNFSVGSAHVFSSCLPWGSFPKEVLWTCGVSSWSLKDLVLSRGCTWYSDDCAGWVYNNFVCSPQRTLICSLAVL